MERAQATTGEHGNASTSNLTLSIGDDLLTRLKERARQNERSLSAEARLILRIALDPVEEANGAA